MINGNLVENSSKCVIEMNNQNEWLRVDCTGDSLRVSDNAGYIKLHSFAPKGKAMFRVTIVVEALTSYSDIREIGQQDIGRMWSKSND